MALFDDQWFTGLQTAATSFFTAVAGAGGAWLALRKKVSSDSADIREVALKTGWLERLVKKSEQDDARIESLRESQLNDARIIARQEAEIAACRDRVADAVEERDQAREETMARGVRVGACEEKVLSLTDQVLDLKLTNGRLFKELAALDKDAAERILTQHLKPQPSKGDEAP